jgi:pyruvate dehydrogenase E2 component (dihydrolipoamide acetyltransferase)
MSDLADDARGPRPRDPAAPAESDSQSPSYDVPMTRLQKAVARRMTAAKAEIPEFITEVDVDMVSVARMRAERKRGRGFVPTYNDFVIKACALALRRVPQLNATFAGDALTIHRSVNVGFAVAADGVLAVPTIFDADRKPLEEIGLSAAALAAKVREGAIRHDELAGGTFTVSNLGSYGVSRFVAVINPPQAGILATGAVEERVVAHEGKPTIRLRMTATLTADHRVVYGADAAEFLTAIRASLEAPDSLDRDAER